jgi:hypothetical protein
MANEVVWYHSEETGAPTLNNVAGSMIGVWDACLINGFNSKGVTISVASAVATVTASAHGYEDGMALLIEGATPNPLNGRKKITVTGSNTYTFAAPGVADGNATGSITSKRAPLGWTKAFGGTNKAVYARSDVTATTMVFRLDDTGSGDASATYARLVMAESAADVDTLSALTPTAAQLAGGYYVPKGQNSATAKKWVLVGDSKTMYFFADHESYIFASYGGLYGAFAGDITSFRPADAYAAIVSGSANPNGASAYTASASDGTQRLARRANGVDAAVPACLRALLASAGQSFGGGGHPVYPSPVDNGLVIHAPIFVPEGTTTSNSNQQPTPLRGYLRGCAEALCEVPASWHKTILSNVVGTDRSYLVVRTTSYSSAGALLLDVTGPW